MTVKSVRATITLQIFPYLNNGQLCKKIAEDAKKIAEGFQVRDVVPTSGTVSFVFKNLSDSQKHRLAKPDDLIMYTRAITQAVRCDMVRLPVRFLYESAETKSEVQPMFYATLQIRMHRVAY